MEINPLALPGLSINRPFLIAGPCSAETEEQTLLTAQQLAANGVQLFRAGVWKPRTKPGCFEGVGVEGLHWLRRVKEEYGMYVATEVATAKHVEEALKYEIDVLWLGARTTANPFAVQEVADALRGNDVPVLIKNPVNPDIELWVGAIERIHNAGIHSLAAIHRGFSPYEKTIYRNQPQWHIPIELHRRYPELPLLCDPSHIGGKRNLIAPIAQQAMDLNFDGLFVESHYKPELAWSDSEQQVTPSELENIIRKLIIREASKGTEELADLRRVIDTLDSELLAILAKRMEVSSKIGTYKKEHNLAILQTNRYSEILEQRIANGESLGMSREFVRVILEAIHEESVRVQMDIMGKE